METQQQSANSSEFKPETTTPNLPVGKPFPNFQPMLPEKMDTETLTAFIASNAKDLAVRSEFLKPYYLELRSRIPQKEWDKLCKTTFDRTRRAIDYWLAGGNPVSKRKPRPDLPSKPEPAANAPATTTFNVADSPAAQEVQTKIDDTPEAEVQPAASDPLAIADQLAQAVMKYTDFVVNPDRKIPVLPRVESALRNLAKDYLKARGTPLDPEPPKPKKTNKTKSPRVEVSEPKPPDWQHRSLLPESEATAWYETCSVLPQWTDCGDGPGDFDRKAINFGTAYGHDGLKNSDGVEYPIEDWMLPLIETVCKCPDVMAPCNYVQCHWIGPLGCVLPHRDPAGMYVPMLCLGHGRVFRVGGKMPQGYYRIAKRHRKIERHIPAEEILCSHGDLLTFIGGKTLHSMFPVAQDPRFVAGAFDHRISLLFRWTTPAMREFGPGDAARKAGHNKQYQEAVESYRNGLTDFLGREVKS